MTSVRRCRQSGPLGSERHVASDGVPYLRVGSTSGERRRVAGLVTDEGTPPLLLKTHGWANGIHLRDGMYGKEGERDL